MIPATGSPAGTASAGTAAGTGATRRSERRAGAWSALFGAMIVVLIASPLLFTDHSFGIDFTNGLWLGSVQVHTVAHAGLFPSFFINTTATAGSYPTYALFEPIYAFYGATLFATLGWLGFLLGENTILAYEILTLVFVGAAYGGFYWLGRQARLARAASHVAPITYVTGAYYASDLYGRSDWAELVSTSAIVLVVASGIALCREPHMRTTTWLLLFCSSLYWSGSHNVTLLYGLFFIAVLAVLFLIVWRAPLPPAARLARVIPPVLLAFALNGWYLVPDLLYGPRTLIAQTHQITAQFFDTVGNMFDPFRAVPSESGTPGLYTQLPVWIGAWCLVAGVLALVLSRRRPSLVRTTLFAVALLLVVILVMIFDTNIWSDVPQLLWEIQFPYRLAAYADAGLAVVAILVLALLGTEAARAKLATWRRLHLIGIATLVGVVAMSVALQVWQIWIPDVQFHSGNITLGLEDADRSVDLNVIHALPASWYTSIDYADVSAPEVTVPAGRVLNLSAGAVNAGGTGLTETVDPPNGYGFTVTNMVGGPYMITVKGMRVVGQSGAHVVVQRIGKAAGLVTVTVTTADSPGIRLGRLLTIVAFLCLLALGVARATARRTGVPTLSRLVRLGPRILRRRDPRESPLPDGRDPVAPPALVDR